VPAGTYDTTIAAASLRGPFDGYGQIRDVANNKRAPQFSAIAAPPASTGNWDSPDTAFNGDLSHTQRISEHRVYGSTTLGQPSTGYFLSRETAAEVLYAYSDPATGWNQQTGGNDGRSGFAPWQKQLFHAGNGDGYVNWFSGIATGTKAGSTHFLANPAIAGFSGNLFGAADGVYLQGVGDVNFEDSGFDVAAQGVTFNFIRTNKTGAKSADWAGIRLQSTGTQAVDAWCSFVGLADRGIDMVRTTFSADKAGFTVAQGTRFYGNATNVDSVSLSRYTVPGLEWFSYETSINGWNFVVNNSSVFQVAIDRVSLVRPPVLPTTTTAALPGAATRAGMEYYVSDANSTTRLSTLAGGGSNFVKVFSNGTNWLIA
jgi:hypothetical protein